MAYYRFHADQIERQTVDRIHKILDRSLDDHDQARDQLKDLTEELDQLERSYMQNAGFYPEPGVIIPRHELNRLARDLDGSRAFLEKLYDIENAVLAVESFIATGVRKDYWKTEYFRHHFDDDNSTDKHRRTTMVMRLLTNRRRELDIQPDRDGDDAPPPISTAAPAKAAPAEDPQSLANAQAAKTARTKG